jgi:cytochrome c oxidase subunit II
MYTTFAASTAAVDKVFFIILSISVALLLIVTVTMIYFVFRYNRKKHPVPVQTRESVTLEIVWTLIPLILTLSMFYFGFEGFEFIRKVPSDALVIDVTGRQWEWSFDYRNGKHSTELYVPVGKPIKLMLHSLDVLHGFYIPAFRLKEDAVPGKPNYLWFRPETMGPADIFCSQYCGQRHSYMMSRVNVLSQEDYDKWINEPAETKESPDKRALALLDKHSCTECHSLDGTTGEGPTFQGLFYRKSTVLAGSKEYQVNVDDAYFIRSITDPNAELVKGYDNEMNPEKFTDEEFKTMIDYLKELK